MTPEEEAKSIGVRFAPFSHWALAWHGNVMIVLREAKALSIRQLYIKEKLGGLRIQGGGAKLGDAVTKAERATDRMCAICGRETPPTHQARLAICDPCQGAGQIAPVWVEP